ncbi:MAG TPA: mechanosensitive ion channel domain-containing protein [Candidatus Sulfotelmatobacter sp.]|jgi:MscS family membrane protein|nr:mechanosensitive ion channel domain-containing protein [Candidatus Sulfotelmatobacter sp.]
MTSLSRRITFLALTLAVCLPLAAQGALGALLQSTPPASTNTPADPLNRETPYGTVFGFLQYAQSGNYTVAAQYLQMSAARRQTDGEALAQKLQIVMNVAFAGNLRPSRLPEGTPQEGASPGRQKLGTMSGGDVEVELELVRVTDPSAGKIWLISSDTLAKVPELYDQVEARRVETRLPSWVVKHQLAGMPLWQWFALILLIPVVAGAAWLVLIVLQIPIRWWARRHGHAELESRKVSGAAWLLVGTLIHRILAGYLGMPLLQRHYYTQVTAVAVIIGTNWILWRVVRWFMRRVRNQALARGHGGTGSLMLLGERLVKAAIFVMAIFFILGVLGFNLTTALAGVGIGTLAIGFGAQQTIANLFGGVSVLGDEVIRVGDVCKFGDRTGTVEDIGLRSTRVRTEERTLLAIPNGTVATINVENLSRRDKMLFKTVLGLHLDTPQEHLRHVLSEIREVLGSHKKVENSSIRVRLTELAASSINVELVCYILTRDFNEFAEVREELLLNIMAYIEDSGTNLASPSQTLYLRTDPGSTKQKSDAVDKKAAPANDKSLVHSSAAVDKNAESNRGSADRTQLESALRNQMQDDGKNFKKDD